MSHWLDNQDVSLREASTMMSQVLVEAREDVRLLMNTVITTSSGKCLYSLLDLISDGLYSYERAKACKRWWEIWR